MPSEPIEAEFAHPPALTLAQEEEFRQLEQEGPLVSPTLGSAATSLKAIEDGYRKEGLKIVSFERGEDPREFSRFKKWYADPIIIGDIDVQLCSRYITLTTSFLCLAVALGSSIVTGE